MPCGIRQGKSLVVTCSQRTPAMFSRTMILAAVATFAALPMAASATSLYHSAPGEAGFTVHSDHLTSSKTRAQVQAEVLAA